MHRAKSIEQKESRANPANGTDGKWKMYDGRWQRVIK